MIKTEMVTLTLPTCAICEKIAPMDLIYREVDAYYNITPKGWVNVMSNVICERCMDELRSIFMEEQKPKFGSTQVDTEDGPKIGEYAKSSEKKEEHWITRNGTRVVVKMPLPAVGSLYSGSPIGMGEKPSLIRWDESYNCVEISWIKNPSGADLALFDLAERLEDSVKKERG